MSVSTIRDPLGNRVIKPVIRFCGVSARHAATRQWAIEQLTRAWGDVAVRSPALPFDGTGYYGETMGTPLMQELVAFNSPLQPDELSDWKHQTNELELIATRDRIDSVDRPVNLDCGYITEAKFVLATTKNRSHRIYLRDCIFAEITLTYVAGKWQTNAQTYPSYCTETVAEFATDARNRLRRWLHET